MPNLELRLHLPTITNSQSYFNLNGVDILLRFFNCVLAIEKDMNKSTYIYNWL